ncbi:MAG: UDP-2,3-diacylglucosamine diphosphatase [Epsilonproteobacteria bacterium]|nr:UDP-2,3-diacylglucosamine diphosphatase [Campylobacterota bacterium]
MKRDFQLSPISLKEGAIFLADAHYQKGVREELVEVIKDLKTKQLFLLGDIFDLLVGGVEATQNQELIECLNSFEGEIIYLEGNHDFLLKEVFDFLTIPYNFQPLLITTPLGSLSLSHGDNFLKGFYPFYRRLINSPKMIKLLNHLNLNQIITKTIQTYNKNKTLCKEITNFNNLAKNRLKYYSTKIVIEGHYHQGIKLEFKDQVYINLPAFGCGKEGIRFDGEKFEFIKF